MTGDLNLIILVSQMMVHWQNALAQLPIAGCSVSSLTLWKSTVELLHISVPKCLVSPLTGFWLIPLDSTQLFP